MGNVQDIGAWLTALGDPIGTMARLLAEIPVGIQVCTASGEAVLSNAEYVRIFGQNTPSPALFSPAPPGAKPEVPPNLKRALAGETVSLPIQWISHPPTPEGVSSRPTAIETVVLPIRGTTDAVTHLAIMARDVTEDPGRSASRDPVLSRLGLILEKSPIGITLDDRNLRTVYWNPAAQRIFGHNLAEVTGKHPWEINIPEESRQQTAERLGRMRQGEAVFHGLVENRTKDGRSIWCEWDVAPFADEHGNFAGTISMVRDVTDQWNLEAQSKLLLENAPDAVVTVDQAGNIRQVNRKAEQQFGYAAGELAGQKVELLIPLARRELHVQLRTDFAKNPHPRAMGSGMVLNARRKEGSEFPCDVALSPVQTPQGTMVIAAIRDVTFQRQIANQLSESEARYRRIVDTAREGIWTIDKEGHTTFANSRIAAMLGWTVDDMAGRHISEFMAPEVRVLAERRVTRQFEGVDEQFEFCLRRRDGAPAWVQLSTTPIRDPDGKIVGALAMVSDITERMKSDAALRESEARYRRIVDNAFEGIWTVDTGHRITFINSRMATLLGGTPEGLLGRPILDFIHPDEKADALERTARRQPGVPEVFERRYVRPDGRIVTVQTSAMTILDEAGCPVGTLLFSVDITAGKQLELQFRQAQKMEAVGRLAGGMAHDFNNMLTVILGYSAILQQKLPPQDPLHELVAQIRRAGERSSELTQRLLVFSRHKSVQLRVANLNEIVTDMEPMLRRLLDENVQLVIRLGQPLGKVRVDPGEVEQVILNLAVNGRDAMPDGGRLTIETSNVTLNADFARDHLDVQPGHYVRLAIADSGTGMSKSTLEHLFEPFFTTKEAGKGTGLGLSTVYGIVRQCGGYVWVDSEERRGTTFQIHFPLAVGPEGTPAARSALHSSAGGQETILMVEDEDAVRDLLHTVLAQSGYRVLPTRDAAEAMRSAEQHGLAIQLLLTDMVMPGMTGLELAQRLRSVRPGLKVLLLSGYTEQPPLTDKDDTHHTQFLQKPVLPDLLLREVRVLLDS